MRNAQKQFPRKYCNKGAIKIIIITHSVIFPVRANTYFLRLHNINNKFNIVVIL